MANDSFVPPEAYQRLVSAARTAGLVLFIGAGVNAKKKLLWCDLLKALFKEALAEPMFRGLDKEDKEILEHWAFADGKLNFYELADLTKFLFGDANSRKLKRFLYQHQDVPDPLLTAVAQLCTTPAVRGVVTYNFDDYLEREVARADRGCESAAAPGRLVVHYSDQTVEHSVAYWQSSGARGAADRRERRLHFYHVHGYVPSGEHRTVGPAQEVVFSQEEYYLNMLNPHSWQTTTQLHYLRNYNCLFIGASLSDMNMNRLLLYSRETGAQNKRWAVMAARSIIEIPSDSFSRAAIAAVRIKATILARLGVELIVPGEEFGELVNFVEHLQVDTIR